MAELFVNLKGARVKAKDIIGYEDLGYRKSLYIIKIFTVNGTSLLSYKDSSSQEKMLKKLDDIFQVL